MTSHDTSSRSWVFLQNLDHHLEIEASTGRLRYGSRPALIVPPHLHLYLVRHGQTLANQKNIFQGSDQETEWTLLSAEGHKQSEYAGLKLSEKIQKHHAGALVHVVSSPAERARHTANYFIQASEKKLRIQFQILECLHEIRFGEMSGKTEEEIRAMGPAETKFIEEYRYRASAAVSAGSSESFLDVMKRVYQGLSSWIQTLERQTPQVIVFYTHMITAAAVRTVLGDKSLLDSDAVSGEFIRWRRVLGNAEPYAWNRATLAFEKMSL